MSNRITIIIMLICVILLTLTAVNGIQIGEFKVLSISQLKEKNQTLNNKISEAAQLTSKQYPSRIVELEETFQNYQIKKQKYEELDSVTSQKNENIYETKQFEIGYLWRKLGDYATKRSLSLGTEVIKNTAIRELYNINFNVSGKYTKISQFITDIENDSELYARIYNFRMSGQGEIVTATFSIRDINLDTSTITQNVSNIKESE